MFILVIFLHVYVVGLMLDKYNVVMWWFEVLIIVRHKREKVLEWARRRPMKFSSCSLRVYVCVVFSSSSMIYSVSWKCLIKISFEEGWVLFTLKEVFARFITKEGEDKLWQQLRWRIIEALFHFPSHIKKKYGLKDGCGWSVHMALV